MKVSLLQTDIRWKDPQANRQRAQTLIDTLPSVDLIVLPEMFTTGFCTDPVGVAEPADSDTLKWMLQVASSRQAAVAGSVATQAGDCYYNRFYFVKPDGSYACYDKRHLFSFAGEHDRYTPGKQRVVVEYNGWRILLQVCYDLRFPVFSRNRGDYDLILYVANWPTVRISAWNTLLQARAIENQCYVVGVNRTGNDPALSYNGSSALIDYLGHPLTTESSSEEILYGELDRSALEAFRTKFPAWRDADSFTLTDL